MADITDYPIAAARALQPWIDKHGEGFIQNTPNPEHYIMRYTSTYHNRFSFWILKFQSIEKNVPYFLIRYTPYSEITNSIKEFSVTPESLEQHFKHWLSLANIYKSFKSPYQSLEDKLFQQASEEIYSLFELLDDNKHIKSYDLKTQFLIETMAVEIIEEVKESEMSDDGKSEIIEDLVDLRETLGTKTKDEVVTTLSRNLARIQKYSFTLFKKVVESVVIELAKKALDSNFIQGLIALLPGFSPDK